MAERLAANYRPAYAGQIVTKMLTHEAQDIVYSPNNRIRLKTARLPFRCLSAWTGKQSSRELNCQDLLAVTSVPEGIAAAVISRLELAILSSSYATLKIDACRVCISTIHAGTNVAYLEQPASLESVRPLTKKREERN